MTILTVNTGSSSVRLSAYTRNGADLTALVSERHALDGSDPESLLHEFIRAHGLASVDAVAHRVVHGGARFTGACLIDRETELEIGRLAPLAPLHNPSALRWIRAAREVTGKNVAQVAVFDTAFFAALPDIARTYAIPHALAEKHGLRRYGFHGLAHQAMWRRWCELRPDIPGGGRGITLQLGSGCSIAAVEQGKPRDTSMGFSPLEGLMMSTRPGDIDAGLIAFLQRQEGLTPEQTERLLNEQSGLLGVSGISADMRLLLESDEARARLAVELYCYRARKYLGAYLAVLRGADAIIFGGGVGENAAAVREKILEDMAWCGVEIDPEKNCAANGIEACISNRTSRVAVWVVPGNEAAVLAREAVAAIAAS